MAYIEQHIYESWNVSSEDIDADKGGEDLTDYEYDSQHLDIDSKIYLTN